MVEHLTILSAWVNGLVDTCMSTLHGIRSGEWGRLGLSCDGACSQVHNTCPVTPFHQGQQEIMAKPNLKVSITTQSDCTLCRVPASPLHGRQIQCSSSNNSIITAFMSELQTVAYEALDPINHHLRESNFPFAFNFSFIL